MVKHDVFGVFSQCFPRTRFWVLGRCRVLGVSWCCHMKVLGSISKANAYIHTYIHTYIHLYIHTYIHTYIHSNNMYTHTLHTPHTHPPLHTPQSPSHPHNHTLTGATLWGTPIMHFVGCVSNGTYTTVWEFVKINTSLQSGV